MELSIKSHGLDLSDPLKAYTARRLRFSLGPFVTQLDGVEVRLGDVNGPRGGIDKRCAIKVMLRRFGVVFARAAGTDVYSTVDRQRREFGRRSHGRSVVAERALRAELNASPLSTPATQNGIDPEPSGRCPGRT